MESAGNWYAIVLRRNRRELVGIVVLLGVLGGVSLFALAGARRTQSSYQRFLRASHASTMAIDPGQYDPAVNAAIAGRPEVVSSTTYVAFSTGPLVDGRPDFAQDFETLGTFDGRFFTMDRFTPTAGRLPNVDRDDEIAVNETAADLYGYKVGQHLDLGTYSNEQISADSFFDDPPPPKLRTQATIVGIGVFIDEAVQDDTNRTPLALVTPAFSNKAAAYAGYAWQGLTLRNGDADVASVKAWYVAQLDPGSPQFFRVTSVDTFHAEQAVRPLSLALAFFGAIAAAATLVLVGQAVNRRVRQGRHDQEVLRSLGASPSELALASLLGPVIALALGSIAAVVLAYGASPFMPVGVVRRVETSPGLDADWTVLGLGAAALFVTLVIAMTISGVLGLPHRRRRKSVAHRSRVVGAATRAGMPPSAVTGLRLAFEPGDGATAVPVRSVMVAGTVAIMTVVATLTFGASFHTLLDTPNLYGWNWDSAIYDQSGYGNLNLAKAHESLDGKPEISGWSGAFFGADSIDGRNLPLLGMEVGSAVRPPLLSGRMIESDDEIVLGTATAHELGKHVGDDVQIGVGTDLTTLRVVGTATLPTIGISHGAHTSLGVGALVVPDLVPGFARDALGNGPPGTHETTLGPPVIFVRFAPGADGHKAAALLSDTASSIGQFPGSAQVIGAQRSAEIVNSSDVGGVPALLALGLGAAAAISLAIALAASVRRRHREFALLQSLGFTRRQLAASIAWQATTTVGVGVVVGVPVGVVLGRTLWTAFADQLDVVPQPSVPIVLLLLVIAGALAIANLAAAFPARMARRVQPAVVLHSE
ncbi:MAG TPA: FtsX-like permease family protein [Ilumatobacteraceae bacterium]|nr:FtsX-like permease family protein [Ilumatobacteraceae bacterium]